MIRAIFDGHQNTLVFPLKHRTVSNAALISISPLVAANRAAQMIQELTGGELLKGVLDAYPKKRKPVIVKARISRINSLIGISLSKAQIIALLKKIDLDAKVIIQR